MNFTKINYGGLRHLLVCTGIALILFGAGCAPTTKEGSKPKTVSVPAEEMMSILWNEGWSPAISVTPGIPIELHGSPEVTYEIAGDTRYLCVDNEGKLGGMNEVGTTRQAEERFYWSPLCGDPSNNLSEIEDSWVHIVRKQEGYTTGMVMVKFSPLPDQGGRSTFKADINASLAFPQQDGGYQAVTDKDLKELATAFKHIR